MSLATILLHLDASPHCAARIELAASIARSQQAHLVGLAASTSAHLPLGYGSRTTGPIANQIRDALRAEAKSACEAFERELGRFDAISYESRLVDDDPVTATMLSARYSDLVIVGQTDRSDEVTRTEDDFVERVLVATGRPTLIVPHSGRFASCGTNVMIAWDASRTAARAVSDALPLLTRARNVEVVVVNAKELQGAHGAEPGADVALWLSRHGVKVTVHQDVSKIDIGNTLLSRAADRSADLLVMGGYGHSKFRELIMGGATRSILTQMTLPVLMSH